MWNVFFQSSCAACTLIVGPMCSTRKPSCCNVWALPLLGLAGLTAKDILGYTAMTFLWSGVVFSTFALLIGYHIL